MRAFHDLNQKCKRQELIIDILKSSPCSTTAPLKERYPVIKDLSSKYSETLLCEALNVAKGSYFNHIFRNANENTQIAAKIKMLTPIVEEIYNSSQQTYGARRIQAVLTDQGYNVSKRTISKILQMHGWFSIQGGAKALYEANRKRKENILNQQFTVTAPNEVWVSDVTYLQYNNRRYYLCVILDLYARKIIAYTIGNTNSTHLTKQTVKKSVVDRRPKENLLFHSDRGSNYISKAFQKYMKELKITQSFSRVGMPYDNSVMESFFKTFKQEEFYRKNYQSEKDFKNSISRYFDYYNTERLHSLNNYRTPERKEVDFYCKQAQLQKI